MNTCFLCDLDGKPTVLAEKLILVACDCPTVEEVTYCIPCCAHWDDTTKLSCGLCHGLVEILIGPIPEGYVQ